MTRLAWIGLLAVAALSWPAGLLHAGDLYGDKDGPKLEPLVLPKPAEVQTFAVYPDKIALKSADDAQQLILTAALAGGRLQDLTGDVKYEVADDKIVRVTPTGRVMPLANGATEITAVYGDKTVKVPVTTANCDVNLPINFGNQIVPIFTKLGCNSGGCHGKASGQNGFKLSLLGFEPEVDYTALVKEARGRRCSRPLRTTACCCSRRPAASPTAAASAWRSAPTSTSSSAAGSPPACPSASRPIRSSRKITVYPEHRIMTRNNKQQFAVYAHYSDGTVEDITRRAQYESNDQEIAVVDAAGLVRTLAMSGEAAIMARYQGHVATFRATVPLGVQIPAYAFEPTDGRRSVHGQEVEGTRPCALRAVHRRAVHSPAVARPDRHAADAGPGDGLRGRHRRRQSATSWSIALLESPEYSYYFANKWADILRVKRAQLAGPGRRAPSPSTTGFASDRRRQAVRRVRPRHPRRHRRRVNSPPTVWYKELQEPEAVRRRHRPGVPRPAAGLCPVPSPSLREVEPGRLLGHGRLLRPRRPQARSRCPASSCSSRWSAR